MTCRRDRRSTSVSRTSGIIPTRASGCSTLPLPACSRGTTVFQFARLCALGAILLAQAPGTSQPPAPQQPQQAPPRFRTETNLVRVDVYATKDGEPVQDLTAADFEVYEDNAPQ